MNMPLSRINAIETLIRSLDSASTEKELVNSFFQWLRSGTRIWKAAFFRKEDTPEALSGGREPVFHLFLSIGSALFPEKIALHGMEGPRSETGRRGDQLKASIAENLRITKIRHLEIFPLQPHQGLLGFFVFERRPGRFFQRRAPVYLNTVCDIFELFFTRVIQKKERKDLQEEVRQISRLHVLGQLAGGIVHDLNNVLAGVIGYASLLKLSMHAGDQNYDSVKEIQAAGERAAGLTKQLLSFLRRGPGESGPVDLNLSAGKIAHLCRRTIDKKIQVRKDLEDHLPPIEGDAGLIDQILLNLCVNAVEAMTYGGELCLETALFHPDDESDVHRRLSMPLEPFVRLSIRDTGRGMDEQTKGRIFETFYTQKKGGKGTGLGLVVVQRIVNELGGFIEVDSEKYKGTVFHVYFKVSRKEHPEKKDDASLPEKGHEVIMLIDDEGMIRNMAEKMLDKLGYRVILAENGLEGLEKFRAQDGWVDLVIIDWIMPGLSGQETYQRMKQEKADVKVLISSGYMTDRARKEITTQGILGIIDKPYTLVDLAQQVRQALEA